MTVSLKPLPSFSQRPFAEASIRQSILFEIKPSSPLHLGEYFEAPIYHLRNFFALALGEPVYPTKVVGYTGDLEAEDTPSPGIEILYQLGWDRRSKSVIPFHMLFIMHLHDLQPDPTLYLRNWFEKAKLLQPVYDLFLLRYTIHMNILTCNFLP